MSTNRARTATNDPALITSLSQGTLVRGRARPEVYFRSHFKTRLGKAVLLLLLFCSLSAPPRNRRSPSVQPCGAGVRKNVHTLKSITLSCQYRWPRPLSSAEADREPPFTRACERRECPLKVHEGAVHPASSRSLTNSDLCVMSGSVCVGSVHR